MRGKRNRCVVAFSALLLTSCIFPLRGANRNAADRTPTDGIGGSAETHSPAAATQSVPASAYLQKLAALGFGKYLEASDAGRTKTSDSGWDVYHYDTADCRCLLGSDYVLAARRGSESTKTVIWFEGGGACFPGRDDCTKTASVNPLKLITGLASPSPFNPVRDWNFIYVPYCDGSIHLGDSDADYDGDGAPDHWHWGLKDTSAAVRLMKELFPASAEILVAGCSAGGYGTIGSTPIVRLDFPQAELYVLNESGLGLMNPALYETYAAAYRTWNIAHLFPPDCPLCGDQFIYMYPWMLARDERLRVGVFSSYNDATFSRNWEMDPGGYKTLLLDVTADVQGLFPDRFHRYFVEGDGHCVQDYSYAVDGVSIRDWVAYLVTHDPRWTDILE